MAAQQARGSSVSRVKSYKQGKGGNETTVVSSMTLTRPDAQIYIYCADHIEQDNKLNKTDKIN